MFTLTPLPYAIDALSPHISPETLEFHHGKHLQGYIDNLNRLISGTEFEKKTLEDIIHTATGPVFNNAAQIYNHDFYFAGLGSHEQILRSYEHENSLFSASIQITEPLATIPTPTGELAQAIDAKW
jgi:superoxide dismutase